MTDLVVAEGTEMVPSIPESGFQITAQGAVPIGILATDPQSERAFQVWYDDTAYALEVYASLPMAIGDMMNFGEVHYPDRYTQIVDGLSQRYDVQTLRNYKSVMKRIPHEVRQQGLSFSHYDAVASLPVEEQAPLLLKAAQETWGREKMREASRIVRGVEPLLRFRFRCRKAVVEMRPGGVKCIVCEDVLPMSEEGELPPGEIDVHLAEAMDV